MSEKHVAAGVDVQPLKKDGAKHGRNLHPAGCPFAFCTFQFTHVDRHRDEVNIGPSKPDQFAASQT